MLQVGRSWVQFPAGVIGMFLRLNPSRYTVVVGSNRALTEMSTRVIFWEVKAAGV